MNALFEITFTRRHISRSRAKRDVRYVLGSTPANAARYLLRTLRRNPQGVFSLVSVAPAVNDGSFAGAAVRARRAARRATISEADREVFRAIARGVR